MSPTKLRVLRRLTLVEAHTTLGRIVAMRERAHDLSDAALSTELRRVSLLPFEDACPSRDENVIWHAVLTAERMRRSHAEADTFRM